jgi:hypothetical protein
MGAPQDFNPKEILGRIGIFFILVGIGLLVLFFISDASGQVRFDYFCWGGLILTLGFVLRGQLRRKVTPSGRFSLVKKMIPKAKQDQAQKK